MQQVYVIIHRRRSGESEKYLEKIWRAAFVEPTHAYLAIEKRYNIKLNWTTMPRTGERFARHDEHGTFIVTTLPIISKSSTTIEKTSQ